MDFKKFCQTWGVAYWHYARRHKSQAAGLLICFAIPLGILHLVVRQIDVWEDEFLSKHGTNLATVTLTGLLDFMATHPGWSIVILFAVVAIAPLIHAYVSTHPFFEFARAKPNEVLTNKIPKTAIEGQPNVTWNRIFMQKVVREKGGYFRLMVPYETNYMFAEMIEFGNRAEPGKNVISAGNVKAQVRFKLKQGNYEATPGAWLENPLNSVRLSVGDTCRLIVAVSEDCFYGWKTIINRRYDAAIPDGIDHTIELPMPAQGEMQVDVLSDAGQILCTFVADISWQYQSWPVFTLRPSS